MNQIQLLTLFNQASFDEMTTLSGIGPALAGRLVAARPYESLNAAKKVSGITANLLEHLMEAGIETDVRPVSRGQKVEQALAVDQAQADQTQSETHEAQVVDEDQSVEEDAGASEDPNVSKAALESRVSDIKEAFREKSQALSEGLTGLGEIVSKRGQATFQAVGELSEKLEQTTKKRGQLWTVLVSSSITALVAILMTLVVLGGINGSLKFTTASQYASLQREADQMASQAILLQQELNGLRGRVDTLEGFGERTVALEKAQEQLAADVQAASQQVTDMQDLVITMNEKITQQEESTRRFDSFLMELQTLLGNLFAPQGGTQ